MKLLKEFSINVIIGLNVFILFFLIFERQIEVPAIMKVAGRAHPLLLHFPIVLLLLAFTSEFFKKYFSIEEPSFSKIIRFLLFASALTSCTTTILGLFLSQEEGYSGDVLQWHKWFGIAVSFSSCGLRWAFSENIASRFIKAGMIISFICLVAAGHFGASLTHGEDFLLTPLSSGKTDDNSIDLTNALVYNDLVRPVLKEKCYGCHNPDKAKGQLVMTDLNSFKKGGKTGRLFTAGKSSESLMIERLLLDINHKHRMPPKGKPQLQDEEIALIKTWIDKGASVSAKLSDYPSADKIHQIAGSLYGGTAREIYDFESADEITITGLNNAYRIVSPVAFDSPGLDITFFSRNNFTKNALEELKPVGKQIVHLNLSGMNVTDQEMSLIAGFSNLRQLNLNYTGITDKGLKEIAGLKELTMIMLSGTEVSASGVASLTFIPKLKRIYAWNTAISLSGAAELTKKKSGLRIDTGFQDDGKDTLTLNNPEFLPKNAFFRQPFQLTIRHPIGGTDLLYTLGGANPDSVEQVKYQKPILIRENTLVKVKAEKKGWAPSKVIEKNYRRSSIRPDTFSLKTTPNPLHKGRGASTLFDLTEGSTDILYASDGNWLGYRNQDFVIEMGFKKPVILTEIVLSTLTSVALESFPPSEVQIWVSSNGATFSLAGKINPVIPGEKAPIQRSMITCPTNKKLPITSLKIIAKPLKKMPPWHKNPGNQAWFFIDEILLN